MNRIDDHSLIDGENADDELEGHLRRNGFAEEGDETRERLSHIGRDGSNRHIDYIAIREIETVGQQSENFHRLLVNPPVCREQHRAQPPQKLGKQYRLRLVKSLLNDDLQRVESLLRELPQRPHEALHVRRGDDRQKRFIHSEASSSQLMRRIRERDVCPLHPNVVAENVRQLLNRLLKQNGVLCRVGLPLDGADERDADISSLQRGISLEDEGVDEMGDQLTR